MGFSLKRALAGAVVGGAHAAGEVFDAQLKEAERDRARIADEERARRQAEYADELLGNREARKQELLDRREADKRKIYKDIVASETAALKEKGVGIGTADGQQAIADAFITAGYPEFGDKFSDNATKAREAADRKELKTIELANAMETRRAARAASAEAREARISERQGRADLKRSEDFKLADKAYNDALGDLEESVYEDNKKVRTDPTIKNWVRASTFELARKDPYAATQAALQLGELINEIRAEKPNASRYEITQLAESRVRSGRKTTEGAIAGQTVDFSSSRGAPAAPVTTTRKGSQPETVVPGILDRFGEGEPFWKK